MKISNFTSVICWETVKCAEPLTYSSGLTITESNSVITRVICCAGIESLGFDQYRYCAGYPSFDAVERPLELLYRPKIKNKISQGLIIKLSLLSLACPGAVFD